MTELKIISRAEAKAQGLKRFYEGVPCKHGHESERFTADGKCVECVYSRNRKRAAHKYATDPTYNEKQRKQSALRLQLKRSTDPEFAKIDRERNAEWMRNKRANDLEWRERVNKAKSEQARAKWASDEEYANRRRKQNLELTRKWHRSNPERRSANRSLYRAQKLNATPQWLTKEHRRLIEWFYAEAQRLTKETGEPWHVDHIVPLRGETVSGLHVPWNLQVISAKENFRKKNKLPDAA